MLTAPDIRASLAGVVTVQAGLPKNGAKTEPFGPCLDRAQTKPSRLVSSV